MAANNPEIVLILGDFSYNGNAAQWWSKNMNALNNLNVIGVLVIMTTQMMISLIYGHSIKVNGNLFTR